MGVNVRIHKRRLSRHRKFQQLCLVQHDGMRNMLPTPLFPVTPPSLRSALVLCQQYYVRILEIIMLYPSTMPDSPGGFPDRLHPQDPPIYRNHRLSYL